MFDHHLFRAYGKLVIGRDEFVEDGAVGGIRVGSPGFRKKARPPRQRLKVRSTADLCPQLKEELHEALISRRPASGTRTTHQLLAPPLHCAGDMFRADHRLAQALKALDTSGQATCVAAPYDALIRTRTRATCANAQRAGHSAHKRRGERLKCIERCCHASTVRVEQR